MIIYLVRHGQTIANEEHRYCGSTDLPLSENGRHQLNELKSAGIWPAVEYCYTSGMLRTQETKAILFADAPAAVFRQFREFDFGQFEMKNYEELKENPAYITWISQIKTEPCPNDESGVQFTGRVLEGWQMFLDDLAEKCFHSVAVITHGGVIATMMDHLFPSQRHFYEWQPSCGEGYEIEIWPDQPARFSEICARSAAGNF